MSIEPRRWDVIVVGAGVFGAWTAWHLQQRGQRVLLLDAHGPAHARASSGGESRMTRGSYGADEIYTRMAHDSLAQWKWLSERSGLPIFHELGVLFFFGQREKYVDDTLRVHAKLKLPTRVMERRELKERYPQAVWEDVALGIFEPEFGALMARRAVQTLVRELRANGGDYEAAEVAPPVFGAAAPGEVRTTGGNQFLGERFVFACGPWLPKLFPAELGGRIFPTRQEVFFFAPPAGGDAFSPNKLPGWADFNAGDIYYGFPDLEARGFKIAHDKHGPAIDPDRGDRIASAEGLADVRGYLARRFPALADAPCVESRVCQYENSANGDLLIDRHPSAQNVWLVGAGSGHGFKHGPEVGRMAADLVLSGSAATEPRFSLATKAQQQNRSVH
ncbi:MAG: FAD-dependent oxidoreductase [Deltaproteobacteria bacterium]|nr:FAD-dependent oxidoreductase [Deltaproteobacteria bacterium]